MAEHGLADLRRRRVTAGALVSLVVVLVPGVLVASRNPWHYVYLMPFGKSLVVAAVLVLAPVALGVAAWLVLRNKIVVRVAVSVAVVLTVLMCYCGSQLYYVSTIYGTNPSDYERTVVAVSPGGSFALVVIRQPWGPTTNFTSVRIQSRAGLLSREAGHDLACFFEPFDRLGPEDTFDSARFLSEYEVEVRAEAGEPWTTTFDPHTLLAASAVSHGCS